MRNQVAGRSQFSGLYSALCAMVLLFFGSQLCFATPSSRDKLEDRCQHIPTLTDAEQAHFPLKEIPEPPALKDKNSFRLFVSRDSTATTDDIVVLLDKKPDARTETPYIAVVCLDRQQDITSTNGKITFQSEQGVEVPISFILTNLPHTVWETPGNEALYLSVYDPNSKGHPKPTANTWMKCQFSPTPPKAVQRVSDTRIRFTVCKGGDFDDYYEYTLRYVTTENGVDVHGEIDPLIVHQPH